MQRGCRLAGGGQPGGWRGAYDGGGVADQQRRSTAPALGRGGARNPRPPGTTGRGRASLSGASGRRRLAVAM
jgi:hypothetical protein